MGREPRPTILFYLGITVPRTNITGTQITDGSIQRIDMDVSTPTQSVITKIIPGQGISISETGTDEGTGDVTVNSIALDFVISRECAAIVLSRDGQFVGPR